MKRRETTRFSRKTNYCITRILFFIFTILLIVFSSFQILTSGATVTKTEQYNLGYTVSSRMRIDSDDDFVTYGFNGSGTTADPYLIENFYIDSGNPMGAYHRDPGIIVTTTNKHFIIRNCLIRGYSPAVTIYNLYAGSARIYNNTCENNRDGISISESKTVWVFNNTIRDNDQIGIGVYNIIGSKIFMNELYNNLYDSIVVDNSADVDVYNNTLFSSKATGSVPGIQFQWSSDSEIYNNIIDGFEHHGIYLGNSRRIECYNNTCTNNLFSGISIWENEEVSAENNTCQFNTDGGFSIGQNNETIIRSNKMLQNAGTGIYSRDNYNCEISYNIIDVNVYDGIYSQEGLYCDIHNNNVSNSGYYGISLGPDVIGYNIYANEVYNNNFGGILLHSSTATNKIYLNRFYSNVGANADDYTHRNTWYSEVLRMGNFYDDWNGVRNYVTPSGLAADIFPRRICIPGQDLDNDSMEDSWELGYGLNTTLDDSQLDEDGDTLTNLEEYEWNSNPLLNDSEGDNLLDNLEIVHGGDPLHDDFDGDGLTDYDEVFIHNTLPFKLDSDNDLLSDGDEVSTYGTDPSDSDSDDDTISDGIEVLVFGTNPLLFDTDTDGMDDGYEINNRLDPLQDDSSQDPDGDHLTNLQEYQYGTDPQNSDTDSDSLPDNWEVQYGLNATSDDALEDVDTDGLTNLGEYLNGTNPIDPDSDDDGLLDGHEVLIYFSDPLNNDTDGDRLLDGEEINIHNTDPNRRDSDHDGWSDYREINMGFNPNSFVSSITFILLILVISFTLIGLFIHYYGLDWYRYWRSGLAGFSSTTDREDAVESGFKTKEKQEEAAKFGFSTKRQVQFAKANNYSTYEDILPRYNHLIDEKLEELKPFNKRQTELTEMIAKYFDIKFAEIKNKIDIMDKRIRNFSIPKELDQIEDIINQSDSRFHLIEQELELLQLNA